jgi:pimeloyl-ACP methyl ester carboxylesterase
MMGLLEAAAEAAEVITLKENGSDAAILFVHGLEGSARTSFTNEQLDPPLSWSDAISSDDRELVRTPSLTRSLSQFDLYAVDYSDVFTDDRVNVSVEQMAQQIANTLDAHSLLREHKYVWIIAHSLGGIVTKRMVTTWSSMGYHRYVNHILGISLLGVPSNGAPLANLGDSDFGKLISAWLGVKARHVSDLKTSSSTNTFLQALENDWAGFFARREQNLRGFPKVACAFETAAQYRVGFLVFGRDVEIVPEIYTETNCDGAKMPINKTHTDLPKPTGQNDPIENWLFSAVRTAFVRLEEVGQEFQDANRLGALAGLIRHINRGHNRTDSIGMPLVDERVEVVENEILAGLKLEGLRYTGASWADILERVAEDNECVEVEIRDSSRRDIRLALSNALACPARRGEAASYVCDISYC